MTHNDVLRSIRYILHVSDAQLIEIIGQGGYLVLPDEIAGYLKHEDESGYVACPPEVLGHFLNGMVVFKRGRDESRPLPPVELPVTNNQILKKLRVAFELKDTDVIALIEKSGTLRVSKTELGAFFRHPDHRNYRDCGNQFLRQVLKGLSL